MASEGRSENSHDPFQRTATFRQTFDGQKRQYFENQISNQYNPHNDSRSRDISSIILHRESPPSHQRPGSNKMKQSLKKNPEKTIAQQIEEAIKQDMIKKKYTEEKTQMRKICEACLMLKKRPKGNDKKHTCFPYRTRRRRNSVNSNDSRSKSEEFLGKEVTNTIHSHAWKESEYPSNYNSGDHIKEQKRRAYTNLQIQNFKGIDYQPLTDNTTKDELKALLEMTEQELFLTGAQLEKLKQELKESQEEKASLLSKDKLTLAHTFKDHAAFLKRIKNCINANTHFLTSKLKAGIRPSTTPTKGTDYQTYNDDDTLTLERKEFEELFYDPFKNETRMAYSGTGNRLQNLLRENHRCIEEIEELENYLNQLPNTDPANMLTTDSQSEISDNSDPLAKINSMRTLNQLTRDNAMLREENSYLKEKIDDLERAKIALEDLLNQEKSHRQDNSQKDRDRDALHFSAIQNMGRKILEESQKVGELQMRNQITEEDNQKLADEIQKLKTEIARLFNEKARILQDLQLIEASKFQAERDHFKQIAELKTEHETALQELKEWENSKAQLTSANNTQIEFLKINYNNLLEEMRKLEQSKLQMEKDFINQIDSLKSANKSLKENSTKIERENFQLIKEKQELEEKRKEMHNNLTRAIIQQLSLIILSKDGYKLDETAKKSIRELFGEDFSKILEAYEDKLKSLQKLCNKYENDFREEYAYAVLIENRCRDYANLLLEVLYVMESKPNASLDTISNPLQEPQYYRLRQKLGQRKDELVQLLRDLNSQDDHREKLKFLNFVPFGNSKEYKVANSPLFGSFDGKSIQDYAKTLELRDKEIERLKGENDEIKDKLNSLNSKFQSLDLERLAFLQKESNKKLMSSSREVSPEKQKEGPGFSNFSDRDFNNIRSIKNNQKLATSEFIMNPEDSFKTKVKSNNETEINMLEGVRGFHHLLQSPLKIKPEYIFDDDMSKMLVTQAKMIEKL